MCATLFVILTIALEANSSHLASALAQGRVVNPGALASEAVFCSLRASVGSPPLPPLLVFNISFQSSLYKSS